MNFQEIHSYYKTLAIADFLPTSLRKVKRLFLPPIKNGARSWVIFILYRGFVININAG